MGEFAVAWSSPARRAIERLPEKVATAAVEFVYGPLPANPYRVGKPLQLRLNGLRSARRGDYRLICLVDEQRQRVEIVGIAHRADAYRPRQDRA